MSGIATKQTAQAERLCHINDLQFTVARTSVCAGIFSHSLTLAAQKAQQFLPESM